MLTNLLGQRNLFNFPKSVYAVPRLPRDRYWPPAIALMLDFFAGSGTTMHATCLLNADSGNAHRSIMVTNNELSEQDGVV